MALFFNIAALVVVSALGLFYYVGAEQSYFYLYPWYDIPLHLMGGLTAGLWACAVASRYRLSTRQALGVVLIVIAPIMVAWELYEYFGGLTQGEPNYVQDTFKDFLNGTIGALLAWGVYAITKKNQ